MSELGMQIAATARSFMPTRFRHQGRTPGRGLDCVGLVVCTARALGVVALDFDVTGYRREPDGALLGLCGLHMTRIRSYDVGDVIVLHYGDDPRHLGIIGDYVHGGFSLIHAYTQKGRGGGVIEHALDSTHLARAVAFFRLPGIPA